MIITQTPLRMSFVGGGSDLKAFYEHGGGAVLSTTIDRYVFVNVNAKFDHGIRIAYSKTEEVDAVDMIEHRLVKATLKRLRIDGGVEITTIADIPSRGTGLGSSSAFTVGLINALSAFIGEYRSRAELGQLSSDIEIKDCGEPIGKQDQYASAFGGFNMIEFHPDDSVSVTPLILKPEVLETFQSHLLVLYTEKTRSASAILKEQSANSGSERPRAALTRMVQLVHVAFEELQRGNIDVFGEILHENWMLKKTLAGGVSTSEIDGWYDAALAAGAKGGKLLGAGAGGFLLFFAPPERHAGIAKALGLRAIPFRFDRHGSRVVYYNPVKWDTQGVAR